MSTTDTAEAAAEPHCWCCGRSFSDDELVRLGQHPEVGLCLDCARWVHRRAVARADEHRGGIRVRGRALVRASRAWVMDHDLHQRRWLGGLLRRLDRRLP